MNKNKILEVKNLCKSFQHNQEKIDVLNNINFDVYDGEIISIVGTSGCGKSTLLNIINGIDKDYTGYIKYNFDEKQIGYMLQEPALFPWLNIKKNASLACDIKNINNYEYIDYLLKRYNLSEFADKFPNSLSGGMKQRVALIRTITSKPKLLLLDEPFAALDYQTRLKISNDVYNLIKENNIPAIIITHDISEAISLSDRVIVLSKRPSSIKKIYNIILKNKMDPIPNRKDEFFTKYYDLIGRDLDIF